MKFFTTSKLSENIHTTPEGYLVCLGVSIARTGEMLYHKSELPGVTSDDFGRIMVTREELEVFRPETIKSFEAKSITIAHPNKFVTPETWQDETYGLVQNVRRGDGSQSNDLVADLLITDASAIALVKAGLREVSCGYEAEYVETGIGRAMQKNIIGNHLALVDEGRAGSAYAINDHKGEGSMTLVDRLKAHFVKASDDAVKLVTEDKAAAPKEEAKPSLESVVASFDALSKQMKDFLSMPTNATPAVATDVEPALSMDERMKKLEDAIASLLEKKSGDAEPEEKKEEKKEEKAEDADGEEGEESEDADEEKEEKSEDAESCDEDEEAEETGDAKSRIEILAPGAKLEGKDAKFKALEIALTTKDGKSVVERFLNGKELDAKNVHFVDAVFIGASEILKDMRTSELSQVRSRQTLDFQSAFAPKGALSPDEVNKKNAEFYKTK